MIELHFTPFPALISQRLRLRRLEPQDQQEVFNLRADERVNRYLDRQPAQTLEDAQAFIEKINTSINNDESMYWAICLKENPRLIGTICIFGISTEMASAEIGYELHPFYQGKGIMQEALSVVIRFGFQVMHLNTINAVSSTDNLDSIRLLERNGFKTDEDFQQEISETKDLKFVRYKLKRE